jgi:hypothetical protein
MLHDLRGRPSYGLQDRLRSGLFVALRAPVLEAYPSSTGAQRLAMLRGLRGRA